MTPARNNRILWKIQWIWAKFIWLDGGFMKRLTKGLSLLILFIFSVPFFLFGATLKDLANQRGFLIGAEVDPNQVNSNGTLANVLQQEFNLCVAGNAMKWPWIHPSASTYNFGPADYLVSFATANGLKVRAHTLLWYRSEANYIQSATYTRAQALSALKTHISTVVGHYKGQIWQWDVLNEAYDGSTATNGLRATVWYNWIGPDYIDSAFVWAHQADPAAKLNWNETGTGGTGLSNYIKAMKARGIPITSFGSQGHVTSDFRVTKDWYENARQMVNAGVDMGITEFAAPIGGTNKHGPVFTSAEYACQAAAYRDAMIFALTQPGVKAFLTWGVSDNGADDGNNPMMFDSSYNPKPAYFAVQNMLANYNSITAVPAPSVSIASPANGAVFGTLPTVPINTKILSDTSAFRISDVNFYKGSTLMSWQYRAPYSYTWMGAQPGTYVLTLKYWNSRNDSATSSPVTVSVGSTGSITIGPAMNHPSIYAADRDVYDVQGRKSAKLASKALKPAFRVSTQGKSVE
jgi:endo-1,4-beta-xylanase